MFFACGVGLYDARRGSEGKGLEVMMTQLSLSSVPFHLIKYRAAR